MHTELVAPDAPGDASGPSVPRINDKLRAQMKAGGNKLLIVTYSLPVLLKKGPPGPSGVAQWSATWIEDDFLARTPHSVANDVDTLWVGVVTRECIETPAAAVGASAAAEAAAAAAALQASSSSASLQRITSAISTLAPPPELRPDAEAPGEKLLLHSPAAGGVDVAALKAEVAAGRASRGDGPSARSEGGGGYEAGNTTPGLDISGSDAFDFFGIDDSAGGSRTARTEASWGADSRSRSRSVVALPSVTTHAAGGTPSLSGAAGTSAMPPIRITSSAAMADGGASSPRAGGEAATPLAGGAGSPTGASSLAGAGGSVASALSAAATAPSSSSAVDASSSSAAVAEDTVTISFDPEDVLEITRVLNAMNVLPIFLPTEMHEGYAKYCQAVLKPCLHNVLETGGQRIFPYAASLDYLAQGWNVFVEANEVIARAVASQYKPGDVVWVNDYPLFMTPTCLAKAAAGGRPAMAFFMHSPFPTSEIFRTLPVRDAILQGILHCDVVGFHSFNYARHFLQSVKRMLGVSFRSRRGGSLVLDVDGRDVLVTISHVGVEAEALNSWMSSEAAAATARYFTAKYPGKVIIAGIDSCQRLSGIALKLLAFERLLEENQIYRQKVVLVQRCEMRQALTADAQRTSQELRERVGRIRAAYGADVIDYEEAPYWPPTYRVGLFHRADILLQTPIREGLNLLPLEYVYVRTEWHTQRTAKAEAEAAASSSCAARTVLDSVRGGSGAASATSSGAQVPGGRGRAGGPSKAASSSPPPAGSRLTRAHSAGGGGSSGDDGAGTVASQMGGGGGASGGNGYGALPHVPVPVDDAPLVAPLPPPPRGGCVILSEFSTASHILNSNLVVNPWNLAQVVREIDKALLMSDEERAGRQWRDYQYAVRNPAASWSRQVVTDALESHKAHHQAAVGFGPAAPAPAPAPEAPPAAAPSPACATSALAPICTQADLLEATFGTGAPAAAAAAAPASTLAIRGVNLLDVSTLRAAWAAAKRRLVVFDYGGTLMSRSSTTATRSDFSLDGEAELPPPVLSGLAALAADPASTVYVVSGLRAAHIDVLHVARLPGVGLAAEYGSFVSHPPGAPGASSEEEEEEDEEGGWDARGRCRLPSSLEVAAAAQALLAPTSAPAGIFSPTPVKDVAALDKRSFFARLTGTPAGGEGSSGGVGGEDAGGSVGFQLSQELGAGTPVATAPALTSTSDTCPVTRVNWWPSMGFQVPAASASAAELAESEASRRKWVSTPLALTNTSTATSTSVTAAAAGSSEGGKAAASGAATAAASAASPPSLPAGWLDAWNTVRSQALRVMSEYSWRVNGSAVREYDSLLAWDYRAADAEWAQAQASFLAADLEAVVKPYAPLVRVAIGRGRVEVSLQGASKGSLLAHLLQGGKAAGGYDFVLVAGDDASDEDMFRAANAWGAAGEGHVAFTVLVGRPRTRPTAARTFLPSVNVMQRLIVGLATAGEA